MVGAWEEVLIDLESDPMRCADRLDWVAKWRLLNGYAERDGIEWSHPKMGALDLQYHDVDPELGLHRRMVRSGAMRRLFTDEEVARACTEPPERTRAYPGPLRGPVQRGIGRRQLGFHGVRHRRGDAQAGAYDGAPAGARTRSKRS